MQPICFRCNRPGKNHGWCDEHWRVVTKDGIVVASEPVAYEEGYRAALEEAAKVCEETHRSVMKLFPPSEQNIAGEAMAMCAIKIRALASAAQEGD